MKVVETHAFAVQFIEIRGFQYWIAMTRKIAVALIIGKDNDYIWTIGSPDSRSENEYQ